MELLTKDLSSYDVTCSECGKSYRNRDYIAEFDFSEDYAICIHCVALDDMGKDLQHQVIENNLRLQCSACGEPSNNFRFAEHQFTENGFECFECFDVSPISVGEAHKDHDLLQRKLETYDDDVDEYLHDYVSSLYELSLDGEPRPGIPYYLQDSVTYHNPDADEFVNETHEENPDVELYTVSKPSASYYSSLSEFIPPATDCNLAFIRVTGEKIGREVEMQAEDGGFAYAGYPVDVGIYVSVPESMIDTEQKQDDICSRIQL